MKTIKLNEELEEKIQELGFGIDRCLSLARILLDAIRGGDNLKYSDIENLSIILKKEIKENLHGFNSIADILRI